MDETKKRLPLKWEEIRNEETPSGYGFPPVYRAKVPGGWLLTKWNETASPTFYPDPDHRWDGSSLP